MGCSINLTQRDVFVFCSFFDFSGISLLSFSGHIVDYFPSTTCKLILVKSKNRIGIRTSHYERICFTEWRLAAVLAWCRRPFKHKVSAFLWKMALNFNLNGC